MTQDRAFNQPDVACIGELVVDFISLPGNPLALADFPAGATMGGSPLNVAAGLRRHGISVSLHGRVGKDAQAAWLRNQMASLGLDTSLIQEDDAHPTRQVVMKVDESGQRSVRIPHRDSAERYMAFNQEDEVCFSQCQILYVSGPALLGDVSYEAILRVMDVVEERGAFLAIDINIPPHHLTKPIQNRLRQCMLRAGLLKLSVPEAEAWLGGGWESVVKTRQLAAVTDGPNGAMLYCSNQTTLHVPAISTTWLDTTGAGDAFWSVLLAGWIKQKGDICGEQDLFRLGQQASLLAAQVIQFKGGTAVYGTR